MISKKLGLVVVASAFLGGCASGIQQVGDDTYTMTDTGAWSWSSGTSMDASLMSEAYQFCQKQGKTMKTLYRFSTDGSVHNFARAKLTFRCQ